MKIIISLNKIIKIFKLQILNNKIKNNKTNKVQKNYKIEYFYTYINIITSFKLNIQYKMNLLVFITFYNHYFYSL